MYEYILSIGFRDPLIWVHGAKNVSDEKQFVNTNLVPGEGRSGVCS